MHSAQTATPQTERLTSRVDPGDALGAFCGRPYAFFLDSGAGDGRLGRFSFLGAEPRAVLSSKGHAIRLWEDGRLCEWEGNPFQALRDLAARAPRVEARGPLPFVGGLVGALGYDLCHFVERLPRTAVDDMGLPDLHVALYDRVAAYDHGTGEWLAASLCGSEGIAWVAARLAEAAPAPPLARRTGRLTAARSHFTRDAYLAAVRRAKDYIAAGDIFQVNLSQRFEGDVDESAADLYRRLRRANPAPFSAYLALDHSDGAILCSSPERFLRVAGGRVETRPIKGTRPRGATPADDERLADELLASAKDDAELNMIVDLERNDLGRVCNYGSVTVTRHKALERYASVSHLVSTIEGRLHPRHDVVDLLRATFPGGSITGAPKVRAMEIIDELEPTQRGFYTGSIGYISADGATDLNIAIRTILLHRGRAWFQVGGGIVADSDPAAEYQETLDKGQRLFQALGLAPP
ncbi:aminodeoxychorismate synthase component I [bacterium]|nr:aminodeoxychorismate synthase component I [bacterium]